MIDEILKQKSVLSILRLMKNKKQLSMKVKTIDIFPLSKKSDLDIYFNSDGAKASGSNVWSNTNPDATKIYIGTDAGVNGSGETYVCYAFAEIKGYSRFGKYIGNNQTSGPFVYTGFKPAWVLVKRKDQAGNNWQLHDIKRTQYTQPINHRISPTVSIVEQTGDTLGFEFFSNGFRPNNANGDYNDNLEEYIYMAFAENPFVANDSGTAVPVVAR